MRKLAHGAIQNDDKIQQLDQADEMLNNANENIEAGLKAYDKVNEDAIAPKRLLAEQAEGNMNEKHTVKI